MTRPQLLPLLLLLGARAETPPASGPLQLSDFGTTRRQLSISLRRRAQDDSLASNALSLNEFNAIRASEAPQDFGGVDSETADGLWRSAIGFEYEVRRTSVSQLWHAKHGSQPESWSLQSCQ